MKPWARASSVLLLILFLAAGWTTGQAAEIRATERTDVGLDRLTEGPPAGRSSDQQQVEEQYGPFRFRCPDAFAPQTARPNPPDTRVFYGCPILVEDEADFFGNIDLAVDPSDPSRMAFFSLHGEPTDRGATSRSRDGLTHTTFTGQDSARFWSDNPIQGVRGGFGEEAAGAFDGDGNIYIGYLWSVPLTNGFASEIRFYKAARVTDSGSIQDAYETPFAADDRGIMTAAARLGMVRLVPAGQSSNGMVDEENATEPEYGRPSVAGNLSNEVIVATWRAAALPDQEPAVPYQSWIDAAWTGTSAENEWFSLPSDEVIGPCLNASAPVAYQGKVYVACSAGPGYDHRPRTRVGDIHIWTIDPSDATSKFVASTGVRGRNPLLHIGPDGYSVVVAYEHEPPHDVAVRMGFGWDGTSWGPGQFTGGADIGPALHRLTGYRPIIDAHVTNFVVTEDEKTIFLFYGEWSEPKELDPQAAETDALANAGKDLPKVLVALNECNPFIGGIQMNHSGHTIRTGGSTSAASALRGTYPPGTFNDAHDGMAYSRDAATGEELIHFALNDHGVAQIATVVVGATGEPCPVVMPQLPPPPVPIPQALSAASMSTVIAGSSIGATSLLMIGYLLTVKRRAAQYVTAEDR